MHGTVTKKGNRWYAVVYEGRDEAGKPKRRWISAETRKADAERVLADLIRKKHEGEPLVLAKGVDHLALRIRGLAEAHRIPVIEDKALARSMYDQVTVEKMIPPEFYEAVAAVVHTVNKSAAGRAAKHP